VTLHLTYSNAGAISKERLIDMLDPPMKQLLLEDLKKQTINVGETPQSPAIPQPEGAEPALPPPQGA
jgi:hypothetical protein